MRVYEVAKELNVSSDALVHLLREMDIPVRSHMTPLGDEHVARLRARLERERRHGHHSTEEAIEAVIGEAAAGPRRRRRRREDMPEGAEDQGEAQPAAAEADSTASPMADAAEAIMAEAAMDAADRGAKLVTEGGDPPRDLTVVVEPAPVAEAPAAPAAEPEPQPAPVAEAAPPAV
ncbi:MAG: translation initiation factor IF-2 N-terminal domain-containing protein, partial [Gemmatimonadota bacterium]